MGLREVPADNTGDNNCMGSVHGNDGRIQVGGIKMFNKYNLRKPVCHCCMCDADLYEGDTVYMSELCNRLEYVCEKCIDDYTFENDFEIKREWKRQSATTL